MGFFMRLKKLILLIVFIALVLMGHFLMPDDFASISYLKSQQNALIEFTQASPTLSAVLFILTYITVAALNLPAAAVMSLLGGALFGLWLGSVLVSFGSTIGATLSFLVSRFIFRESVERRFPMALRKIDRGIEREGAFYLFALRLVPIFPFFLINAVMGLTNIRTAIFFFVSQIGMLPGTLVYVYAGTQLGQLTSLQGIMSPGLLSAFILLGALPVFSRVLVDTIKAKKSYLPFRRPRSFDYNLVAIGGGAAGLVTAYIAAAVKAKVLLIEKHRMGGDCLNTGCVPSKALVKTSKLLHDIRRHAEFGISRSEIQFSFPEVMERVHAIIKKIEPHDSIERYTQLGVDCEQGTARVVDPFRVAVNGRTITTRNIVIATGARPFIPEVPGIEHVTHYTSDTIWEMREQPAQLLIVGGGPIGCEIGQAFQRLGTAVTIVQRNARLLKKEDPEASAFIAGKLAEEGVQVLLSHELIRFQKRNGEATAICVGPDGEKALSCNTVLFALGRTANTHGFGLEELGIGLRPDGTIETDEFLRTKYPNIFACGDVTGPYQLTHASAHQAWYASVNALFQPFKKYAADYRVIPRVTFTDPEVAHVGLTASQAEELSVPYSAYTYHLNDLDRAITDSQDHGFIKVLTRADSDQILGATIVGAQAGEYLSELTLAMKYKIGLNKILGTVHPYPTFSEANKYAAGIWKKSTKPEKLLAWVGRFHKWRRG